MPAVIMDPEKEMASVPCLKRTSGIQTYNTWLHVATAAKETRQLQTAHQQRHRELPSLPESSPPPRSMVFGAPSTCTFPLSMPARIFLEHCMKDSSTPSPESALVSRKIRSFSCAKRQASTCVTSLCSFKSHLFPTTT